MAIETTSLGPPRADLDRSWYEDIILQKGRNVIHQKAILCPCKSKSTNAQSNCKNCGGIGWLFINPKETRMIITGLNIVSDVKGWSEESRGTINISCSDTEELSYMDKITLTDGESIHSETIHLRRSGTDVFAFTAYPIKKILYAGLYINETTALTRVERSDITIDKLHLNSTLIKLNPSLVDESNDDISLTLRYKHAPVYHVLEMRRETMQSFKFQFLNEQQQNFPLSAIGRRAHYMTDQITLGGDTLINNSYDESLICDDGDEPLDVCDIIISKLTGQQRECLKSILRNSNDTFTQVIEVASTNTLEDVTYVVNVNGVLQETVVVPSMIDQVINITF